jgi:hypothetical protein
VDHVLLPRGSYDPREAVEYLRRLFVKSATLAEVNGHTLLEAIKPARDTDNILTLFSSIDSAQVASGGALHDGTLMHALLVCLPPRLHALRELWMETATTYVELKEKVSKAEVKRSTLLRLPSPQDILPGPLTK